jgi:undecaprenyl phosphate-alpha-L-ara4N flippase subunit ArnF
MTIRTICSRHVLLVGCSIVLSAAAQLLMKSGMLELGGIDMTRVLENVPAATADLVPVVVWVAAGLVLYVISMLCWLAALTKYELSLAYPLLSLSYVMVYVGAVAWPRLHETVSLVKTIGILLILGGVFLVTTSNNERRNTQDTA